jgi:trypsin
MVRVRIGVVCAALIAAMGFGLSPSHAVVGGTNVPNGAYPFMASVQDDGFHFCGGSVIASNWVLTAAHCVPDGSAAGLSVVVGTTNNSDGSGTRIPVTEVRVHPLYASDSVFDAALLRLASSVPAGVSPITLSELANDNLEANGAAVTVAGWGDNNPATMGLLAGPTLKEASLNVVGDQQCMGSTTSTEAITTVCAEKFAKDSCQGDSGGPLFAKVGTSRIQVGIVSRGLLCAIYSQPGMYSEVNNADIRGFIRSNTGV